MSIWDDPDLEPPDEQSFVRLETVGDGFSGRVVNAGKARFDDKDGTKFLPQLTFVDDKTGEERTWTVGQTDARRKLSDRQTGRPETGDHIAVRLTGTTGKFKHIDVRITRLAPQAAPTYAPTAGPVQPTYAPPPPTGPVGNGSSVAPTLPANPIGNGNPVAPAPPPPPNCDPGQWARMSPEQRQLIISALGGPVPAF
jgi:hypothetical protein